MATVQPPKIDDLELSIQRDTANAEVTVEYRIIWSEFDRLTNLVYDESWELVGVDPANTSTLYTEASTPDGINADGNDATQRSFTRTIPFADLNEDPSGTDEIMVVVTLSPRLPTVATRQSSQVLVNA